MEVPKISSEGDFFNKEQSLQMKNFNLSDEQQVLIQPYFEKLRFQSDIFSANLKSLFSIEFLKHYEFILKTIKDNIIIFNQLEDKDSVNTLEQLNSYINFISDIIDKSRELFKTLKVAFDIEINQYVSLFLSVSNEIMPKNDTAGVSTILNQDSISKSLADRLVSRFSDAIIQISESFYSFCFLKFEDLLNKADITSIPEVDPSLNSGNSLNQKTLINKLEETSLILNKQIVDFSSSANKQLIDVSNNFELQLELALCEIVKQQAGGELTINDFTESSLKKVKSVSDKIQKISDCFFNEYVLNIRLELINASIIRIFRLIYLELARLLKQSLGSKNQQLLNDIELLIQIINQQIPSDLNGIVNNTEKIDSNVYAGIEKAINSSISELEIILESLPERYEFVKNVVFSEFKLGKINQIHFYKVLAAKIVSDIINNSIKPFLSSENFIISNKVNEIDNDILSQNKLIKFSLFKQDSNQLIKIDSNNEIDIEKFLNDEKQKALGIYYRIDNVLSTFEQGYSKLIDSTCNLLNINNFKDQARYFKQYLPKRQSNILITNLRKLVSQIIIKYNKLIYYFWFNQSNAQILRDELIEKHKAISSVKRLLNTIEPLILNQEVRFKLPFYYMQLFLNNQSFNNEFWYGRNSEIEKAGIAYKRFLDGYNGSLLITGERYSGKTFMINYIASHLNKSGRIISIEAPGSGEIDEKFLHKKIQEKTGIKGDYKKIFSVIESGSIIVFDDLELWWVKAEKGSIIIKQIIDLIEEYCHQVFFIVSVNSHSFMAMNTMIDLKNLFLDIINCKPFNAKALQDIVLGRHRITSLKFKLVSGHKIGGKKDEALFVPKNYAHLFSKYFNYSNGNIGVCLHGWMSNISGIEGEHIIMKLPQKVELSEFDLLKEDELLILYHLIIHKKMDVKKLSRVLLSNESEFNKHLLFLKRLQIVVENEQILEINPYINHLIVNVLKTKEML